MKIALGLIHNNNNIKNDYLRSKLIELSKSLEIYGEVRYFEAGFQPEVTNQSKTVEIYRDIVNWALNRKWLRYRMIKPLFLAKDIIFLTYHFTIKYIISKVLLVKWRKSSTIEMMSTDKHIRIWNACNEYNADFVFCFEDDTIFKDDSIERILEFINIACQIKEPLYVDLAGGLKIVDLKLEKLDVKTLNNIGHTYSRPVTNTTCCYFINSEQLQLFTKNILNKPFLRYLAIDFMINYLFIIQLNQGILAKCIHADPTIFHHGSFSGYYDSWGKNII